MTDSTRRSLLGALGAAASTVAAFTLGPTGGEGEAAAAPQRPKRKIRSPREVLRDRYFPNVTLTTHEGKKVRFYDDLVKDKLVTLNFMYARCERSCPGITRNLARLQALLGDRSGRDVFMYSLTLKPEEDSPAALARYAQAHGAKPGWLFLTGARRDLEALRRSLGYVDLDPAVDRDKSSHIGNVRIGNEPLLLWAAAPGLGKPEGLLETVSWVDWPKGQRPAKPCGG